MAITPTITNKTNLFYRAGSSDKVYHLWIENVGANYTVKFKYGRRGSTLNEGKKNTMSTHAGAALKIFNDLLMEKLRKGYRMMDDKGKEIIAKDEDESPLATTTTPKVKPSDIPPSDITGATTIQEAADRIAARMAAKRGSAAHVPMLLNQTTKADVEAKIKDKNWVFQEKHDGRRMQLGRFDDRVKAHNRKGELIEPPSEYCSVLQSAFKDYNFIIDGEACGPVFWAFDILLLEGADQRELPLVDRLINLGMLMRSSQRQETIRMVVTAETEAEKRSMFNEAKRQRKEGVAIKQLSAKYTSGRPASGGPALKFKFVASATLEVMKVNTKRSVEVGGYVVRGRLTSVGNVTIPANHDIPKVGDIVEVQYLYYYGDGGSLYQPVYLGKRDDVEVDALGTLKLKGDQE